MPTLAVPTWSWAVLAVVVISSLAIDLFGHRGGHSLGRRAAIGWSIAWVAVSLAFAGWVALQFGAQAGSDFVTAYLVEKSLSVDNLFVFLVIFGRLRVPEREQHRVLFWGILGALATRGAFIAAGSAILTAWHGAVYVMGAFLIYTGINTARAQPDEPKESRILDFVRRHLPLTPRLHGHQFIAKEEGRRVVTPLFLALAVIEITDVLFAVDSVPAALAVSSDPFIVYSSNIFAILGLRALYLVLAGLLADLKYLRFGLAAILVFVGVKMLGSDLFHLRGVSSLAIIAGILVVTIVPSIVARRRHRRLTAPDVAARSS